MHETSKFHWIASEHLNDTKSTIFAIFQIGYQLSFMAEAQSESHLNSKFLPVYSR